jgi:hypothetical protein
MAGKQISLNATVFTPIDVQETVTKIGDEFQGANGARRFAHRANKREWRISWRRVLASVRTGVRGIYALTSSFTFIDEDGTSYTVFCPPGGYSSSISLIAPGVTLYYDIELTIKEC